MRTALALTALFVFASGALAFDSKNSLPKTIDHSIEKFLKSEQGDKKLVDAYRVLFTGKTTSPESGSEDEFGFFADDGDKNLIDGCNVEYGGYWAFIKFSGLDPYKTRIIEKGKAKVPFLALVGSHPRLKNQKSITFYKEGPYKNFNLELQESPGSLAGRKKALQYVLKKCVAWDALEEDY